jgi:DNA processing protein
VVVSGLARGIDAAAHGGSISGGTVAVIAGGLDVAYPPEHAELQARIAAEGLLVAEQPLGVEPQARHFPRRNRIISGLSRGVVIDEAAPKSGSLITARFTAEQGREVMAVPGSRLDPRAQWCNALIRDARPVRRRRARDAQSDRRLARGSAEDHDDEPRTAILSLLSPVPVPVDELVRQSLLPPATVQTILLELELASRLACHAGGRVALA